MKITRGLPYFFIPVLSLALASSLLAQRSDNMISAPAGSALPPSMQKSVQVMVELNDAPAGVAYATALKQAQAQYDQQRNYALQHPTQRASQAFLKSTVTSIQISSAAATQVKNTVTKIDQ